VLLGSPQLAAPIANVRICVPLSAAGTVVTGVVLAPSEMNTTTLFVAAPASAAAAPSSAAW
jgi:hypothetical protein